VFVPPDFTRYKAVSRQIKAIFLAYTDLVETLSLDEAYLDVTDRLGAAGSATEIARAIRADIRRETALTASAGVGPNKLVAKIASDFRKPDGLYVVPPARARRFLAGLPIRSIPGVGKVTEQRLAALGFATVAEVQQSAPGALDALGSYGARLYELCQGIDHRRVEPNRPHVQVSAEDTLPEDVPLEALSDLIGALSEKVWVAYQAQAPRLARTLVLKLKTADFRILTRSHSPPVFPTEMSAFAELAQSLKARVGLDPSLRYRLVGVGVSGLRAREAGAQPDLFETEGGSERLDEA
jgi:DNA polymerase-4